MNVATSMIENSSESGGATLTPMTPEAPPKLSAGQLLRQAREAQGIRPDALASALKVPVQKIEALENDAIELLPDAVFARALAASVCRALRIDPALVLAQLPGAPRSGLAEADATINPKFSGGSKQRRSDAWGLSNSFMTVIILLLLGALVLYFLPQSALDAVSASLQKTMQQRPAVASETVTGAVASLPDGSSEKSAGTVVEPVAAELPLAPREVSTALVGAAPLPVASASSSAIAPSQPLVFAVRTESWITVTDSRGAVLLKRIVPAGETVGVAGSLPFSVVVGRALGVDVQVRGQPFDLKPLMGSGGVARFSVNP